MIGIQSSIIMFPVNLLIVSIFRFTRPRKKIQKVEEDQQPKFGSSQQEKKHSDTSPQWCKQTDITVEYVIKVSLCINVIMENYCLGYLVIWSDCIMQISSNLFSITIHSE